jgi:hypothetical protein
MWMASAALVFAIWGITMTELEQARAHLRQCQSQLATLRQRVGTAIMAGHPVIPGYLDGAYALVLAALSWVWDAQERKIAPKLRVLNEHRTALGLAPIKPDDPDIYILLIDLPHEVYCT